MFALESFLPDDEMDRNTMIESGENMARILKIIGISLRLANYEQGPFYDSPL